MRRQFINSRQGDLAQDHVEVDQGDRAGHHHPLGQLHARQPHHLESPSEVYQRGKFLNSKQKIISTNDKKIKKV